jgi:hypothetical protein
MIETVFSAGSSPRLTKIPGQLKSDCFNVTSGGIRCSKGTPIIKKPNPFLFIKRRNNERRKKNKSLDTEQIYGHGSQRASMSRVTVLAGCRQ